MSDDFSTNGSSYARDHFYVTATDTKGHSQKARINVPPEVSGRIAALIARQAIPMYRTEEDFFRDALVHRLHDLDEILGKNGIQLTPSMEAMAKSLMAEAEIEQRTRLAEQDRRLYNSILDALKNAHQYEGTLSAASTSASAIVDQQLRADLLREIDRYQPR